MTRRRIAVVGGGITGLAAAHELTAGPAARGRDGTEVVVFEAAERPGGKLRGGSFAGVADVDEGADAVLARTPDAVRLAEEVGLGDDLVHPEPVSAAVWFDGLHPIPADLVLGIPRRLLPLVRSRLLTWRGTARAAVEPLLPRRDTDDDAIGPLVRARFGDEVHERIVDALVGSIYATDTDRASLAEVPQLAALAQHRSLLLAARRQAAAARAAATVPAAARAGTATGAAAPIFAAPRSGVAGLAAATARSVTTHGGSIRHGRAVGAVRRTAEDRPGWLVDEEHFDGVVLATPAAAAAQLLRGDAPEAAALLDAAETADVVMVTLHVPAAEWPARLRGLSGYLVPKPVQHLVTAASFGSQKWAHWRPPAGGELLRVSLGRDGLPVLHLDDDQLLDATLGDLHTHLGVRFHPLEVRITRWPGAFPQYRPHHAAWRADVAGHLPPGVHLAGAAYDGIGVPACVRSGRAAAARADAGVTALSDLTG
jgi:oxygen-dependent protoporphyrinogen oxidase